jgi:hypothetical protein
MALIDDWNATLETGLRNRVAVATSRVVMEAVAAGNPPAANLNLARQFMLNPSGEVDRYVLPIIARLIINGVALSAATDAQLITATQQVLAVNAQLGIGVTIP